jgi:hypothetical protein
MGLGSLRRTGRVFKGIKPRLICQFSVGKVLARMIGLGPVQVGFGVMNRPIGHVSEGSAYVH